MKFSPFSGFSKTSLNVHFFSRSSETVRCELARDPKSKVDGIQTEDGIGGRKLIVSGGI